MLENPAPTPPSDSTAVKRYAPPNQRNRSLNRRKSGDRFDRVVNHNANDGEKNQPYVSSRSNSTVDHGDATSYAGLIPLDGCCRSEVTQLLNDRWAAVMYQFNDTSVDLSERPVMYSGSTKSAWGQFRLPHQFMAQASNAGSPGPQMDFLSELQTAMRNANPSFRN